MDIDSGDVKKLKYPCPDMQQYNIAEYLNYDELALIAGDPDEVDYENLSESQKKRYSEFVGAWWTVQRQRHEPIAGPDQTATEE